MSNRKATIKRETRETRIEVELDLDGTGNSSVATGNGMLDHMVEQLARHGLMDITVSAQGDVATGWHHLVEDVAIVLGRSLNEAVGDGKGILRMGHALIPLDETLAQVVIDLSGRPYAVVKAQFEGPMIGDMPSDLVRHFLEILALEGRFNLHAQILAGTNDHHKAEALFKALARSLRQAVTPDPRAPGDVPSTKGTISG
jgi:imidazoleglycerol-phosphate dehydratase